MYNSTSGDLNINTNYVSIDPTISTPLLGNVAEWPQPIYVSIPYLHVRLPKWKNKNKKKKKTNTQASIALIIMPCFEVNIWLCLITNHWFGGFRNRLLKFGLESLTILLRLEVWHKFHLLHLIWFINIYGGIM